MELPEDFETELERRKKLEEKVELESIEKEKKYCQILQEQGELEKSKLELKIEICEKIFAWKDEFIKTKEGKDILEKQKFIWAFNGGWGHTVPRYGGYGCWGRIYFKAQNIEYFSGYKWFATHQRIMFKKPEEMAKTLNYEYLEKFFNEIETKEIFNRILAFNKYPKL